MTTSNPRKLPRKWINKRLAELDAEKDYEEIVRLTALYRSNNFELALMFSAGTPGAGIASHVMDAVWRNGKSESNHSPEHRRDTSNDHLMTWFEHGPEHAATKISVDMVNQYHQKFAKKYFESFNHAEDYIYILCMNATLPHVMMTSIGLEGFTQKQRIATWIFWFKISEQFTLGTSGENVTTITEFPTSFEGMVETVKRYQARPREPHQVGHDFTSATIEFFARSWFPRPLHFFGRALVKSFIPEVVLQTHSIALPSAPLRAAARLFMKTAMFMSNHIIADPAETLPERRRISAAQANESVGGVDAAIHRQLAQKLQDNTGVSSLCPHMHFSQKNKSSAD